jgi:hypothetical protein
VEGSGLSLLASSLMATEQGDPGRDNALSASFVSSCAPQARIARNPQNLHPPVHLYPDLTSAPDSSFANSSH